MAGPASFQNTPKLASQAPAAWLQFGRDTNALKHKAGKDSFSGLAKASEIPDEVKPPSMQWEEYEEKRNKLLEEFAKDPKPPGNWINNPLGMLKYWWRERKLAMDKKKLNKELFEILREGARLYLPEYSRNQLFGYLRSFQRVKDYFNIQDEGLITRNIISMCGPPVVKYFQIKAQQASNTTEDQMRGKLRELEDQLEGCQDKLKKALRVRDESDPSRLENITKQQKKEAEEDAKYLPGKISELNQDIGKQRLLLQLRDIIITLPNKVPPSPYKLIKPEIDKVTDAYNRKFKDDPIVRIDEKELAAGSVAQTYLAHTKSGRKRIVKVFRPEADPAYFDEFNRFSQFLMLFLYGRENAEWAKEESNELMEVFKHEVRVEREKLNAERLKARLEQEGYKINVPQFMAYTDRGFVEEYAEGMDLADKEMPSEQRAEALQTLGPMLVKSFLFYPEKYFDPQGGNLRWPAAIFDYGRMGLVNEDSNRRILRFMQDYLLCECEEDSRKYATMRDRAVRQLLKEAPEDQSEIRGIFNRLTTEWGSGDDLDREDRFPSHRVRRGWGPKGGTLFQIIKSLPDLVKDGYIAPISDTESPIHRQDIIHAREKLQALMQPYFQYAGGDFSDEKLLAELRKMRPEAYQDLVETRSSAYNDGFYDATWKVRSAAQSYMNAKSDVTRSLGGDISEKMAKLRKKEAKFRAEMNSALDREEARTYLLQQLRIDKHLQVMAEDLYNTLFKNRYVPSSQKKQIVEMLKIELTKEFTPYEALDDE